METQIVILVSKDVSESERDSFRNIVAPLLDVTVTSRKSVLPDWDTLLAIVKDAGTFAAAASALLKLADAISEWRRKTEGNPKIRLERPNRPTLDLEVSSDEELTDWFKDDPEESDGGQGA